MLDFNELVCVRLSLPSAITTDMLVWEWSALKRWPQPSVEPSSWPSCQSSLSGEATGVTRSESPTPFPARWGNGIKLGSSELAFMKETKWGDALCANQQAVIFRWLVAVALSWCVWSLLPVVLASCLLLFPRSCSWWLVLTTATPQPEAARPPWATLVRRLLIWFSQVHMELEYALSEICFQITCSSFLLPPSNIMIMAQIFNFSCFFSCLAKATFDAISKTYSYLTPDLWKETVFTKSPYQVNIC